MSGDIVERLGHVTADDEHCRCLKCEAAAEIEWLRTAGDALAEVLMDGYDYYPEDLLIATWNEARRER